MNTETSGCHNGLHFCVSGNIINYDLEVSSWGEPSPEDDPMVDMEGTKNGPAVSVLVVYCTIPPLFEADITPCIVSMLFTLPGRTASKIHQSGLTRDFLGLHLSVLGGVPGSGDAAAGDARCGPQSWPHSPPH